MSTKTIDLPDNEFFDDEEQNGGTDLEIDNFLIKKEEKTQEEEQGDQQDDQDDQDDQEEQQDDQEEQQDDQQDDQEEQQDEQDDEHQEREQEFKEERAAFERVGDRKNLLGANIIEGVKQKSYTLSDEEQFKIKVNGFK